jgi:predicted PurR-regulated permease PerM
VPPQLDPDNSPRRPIFVESPALIVLAVLAVAYSMYFAAFIVMPIAFASVLAIILLPIVRFLRNRMFIPSWAGAAITLLALLGLPIAMIYGLTYPAAEWLAPGFEGLSQAERRLDRFLEPLRQIRTALERAAEIAAVPDGDTVVRVREDPGFAGAILDWTQGFLVTGAIIAVLLYFLLATDGLVQRKFIRIMPTRKDKERAMDIAERIQSDVSHYLLTITVINILLGVAVGLAMWVLGMPSPLLWGILAALFNYIPYLGALAGVMLAGIVALVTFDSAIYALVVALVYYALTALEGNFIIPAILGRRLFLNPVVVFIGLIFWGWVWGIPGALLAVPMLSIIKIVADHIESMGPLSELLGR